MAKALMLAGAPFFLSTISDAQQHAPTLAVCQADAAVWGNLQAQTDYLNAEADRHKNNAPNRTPLAKLSLKEVVNRADEMRQCEDVDPDQAKTYLDLVGSYNHIYAAHCESFIERHHLLAQLYQEDAAGKR
jgi:hypothetical protein